MDKERTKNQSNKKIEESSKKDQRGSEQKDRDEQKDDEVIYQKSVNRANETN